MSSKQECAINDPACIETPPLEGRSSYCPDGFKTTPGVWQLQAYGFNKDYYSRNVFCLIAWLVVFRLVGLLLLTFRYRKSKR